MASVFIIPQLNKLTHSLILCFMLDSKMFTWYYADQLSLKFLKNFIYEHKSVLIAQTQKTYHA